MAGVKWSFAEACDRATSVGDVGDLFLREVEQLGFSHVACCSHVDPLKPPPGSVMILRYPPGWVDHFSANGYAALDPVFQTARRQALPFQWSDPRFRAGLTSEQRRVLDEASEFGIGDGFTVPLHAPDALPASCSLVIGPDGVDPLEARNAHWYAVYAHEAARRLLIANDTGKPPPRLSRRERQCLELVGRGKDDYSIGVILGISQSTAHNTVQRAMAKFGVATRIQAVVRALRSGEIALDSVAP
jgi:DNA-binding CsgD family transcriptional regulator